MGLFQFFPLVCFEDGAVVPVKELDGSSYEQRSRKKVGQDEKLDHIVDGHLITHFQLAQMLQAFQVVLGGRGENLSHQLAQLFHCAGVNEAQQLLERVGVDVDDVGPIGNFLSHLVPEHGGEDGRAGRQDGLVGDDFNAVHDEGEVAQQTALEQALDQQLVGLLAEFLGRPPVHRSNRPSGLVANAVVLDDPREAQRLPFVILLALCKHGRRRRWTVFETRSKAANYQLAATTYREAMRYRDGTRIAMDD